jgi:quercetin dioxygenase-like cupin family protein
MQAPEIIDKRPPEMTEFYADDWLFVGLIPLKAGEVAQQHVHTYDHPTVIPYGTVRAWDNDVYLGEKSGPTYFTIKAHHKHRFYAVTDTLICCCHNLRGEGYPATEEG